MQNYHFCLKLITNQTRAYCILSTLYMLNTMSLFIMIALGSNLFAAMFMTHTVIKPFIKSNVIIYQNDRRSFADLGFVFVFHISYVEIT